MKSFISFISLLLLSITVSAQFGAPVIIDSNIAPQLRNIIAVDIDNDGLKDIVISHQTDTIKWYKNLGNNTFSAPVVLTSTIAKPFFIATGDADNDSKTDLLVANNNSNNSQVVLINNNGLIPTIIDSGLDVGTYRAYFTDFDNDGDEDIIACSDLMITLYLNNGAGVFGGRIVLRDNAEFYNLTVADFNGDNFPDIGVSSSNGGEVQMNDTSDSLSAPNLLNLLLSGFITHTDVNNDGQFDIVYPSSTPNHYDIYRNTGGGNFTLNQSVAFDLPNIQNPPFALATVNADAFADAVYSRINNNRSLYWQENDGAGNFQNEQLIDNTEIYDAIFLADLDNDGDNDILWYGFNFNAGQKKIGIIENYTITLGVDNIKSTTVRIYPNPTSTLLSIESQDKISSVEIYSANGEKIATYHTSQIDISKFENGIYILNITTNRQITFTTNFIKL
ncbi:MAG: T9SS type A sorting domain-containing protein [Bacteroidia bacterium]|nr:T9SS type A sorting domain-containing protein [Bacteroidia bacterium]MCZ2278160.1 T9SS type A sorting domain-containing protein [Bacteroidia bacterium]